MFGNNFGFIALAALIALLLLARNRRKGSRDAIIITLAVIIVCGCACNRH